jgi:2-oxo-4-hydroxy-4-carboxy-5-ureidoimidazoline decarboxylase
LFSESYKSLAKATKRPERGYGHPAAVGYPAAGLAWLDVRMANPGPQASSTLGSFNAAPAADAERDVLACCASTRLAKAVADGRPYPDPAALLTAVDAAFATLSWDDIAESMNGHPRIGDRTVRGGMSAAEQSGAAAATDEVRQGLADGNLAYEQRFGHIFLICATGLSGQEMLTRLRARLENDQDAERDEVRAELLKITRLRMTKLLSL